MRITGGKFKGTPIISKKQKDEHIRPTSGKVREAIFNLLYHGKFLKELDVELSEGESLVEGRIIADIYSGTGIFGFESISRGAKTIIFVDKNEESLRINRQNAKKFELEDSCIYVRADATNLPTPPAKVDLIFMDPPYDRNLVAPSLNNIATKGWLMDSGVVIIEHSKKEEISESKHFKILDKRPYNNTVITILKKI